MTYLVKCFAEIQQDDIILSVCSLLDFAVFPLLAKWVVFHMTSWHGSHVGGHRGSNVGPSVSLHLGVTMCSTNLHRMHIREIGLLLAGHVLSPFLKMGQTLAFYQTEGNVPSWRNLGKITCRMGTTSKWSLFRNKGLMRSGPSALSGFRPCSNFMMPFNDMLMSVMLVYFSGFREDVFWVVMTWFLEVLNFLLAELFECSGGLRGEHLLELTDKEICLMNIISPQLFTLFGLNCLGSPACCLWGRRKAFWYLDGS